MLRDWRPAEAWLEQNRPGPWRAMAPLAEYTSWKIGGPARLLVWPETEAQAASLLKYCSRRAYPVRFLGLGTNLLAADEGVEALVVHTGKLDRLRWTPDSKGAEAGAGSEAEAEIKAKAGAKAGAGVKAEDEVGKAPEEIRVCAQAGLPLAVLAAAAVRRGLRGLEFAAGIPGSVGGALVMNAGAYGGQMADLTESVRVTDDKGNIRTLAAGELDYGYRSSALSRPDMLVLSGTLRLRPGGGEESRALTLEYLSARRGKQPLDMPSGGSVFRNPAGGGAGRCVEAAGLKGLRLGDAQISPLHANFIVNLGEARASDVLALMDRARAAVKEKFGIELEREIVYWN